MLATMLASGVSEVKAQKTEYYNTKHEVGVTIGAGATTEIFSGLTDFTALLVEATVSTVMTGGTYTGYHKYGDEKYIPNISAEYYYHVNKIIGLGGFLAFNGMDRDIYAELKNNTNDTKSMSKIGKATRRNFSLIPTAKIDWLRTKNFGMYTKGGIGVSFLFEKQKDDASDDGADFEETSDTTVIPNVQFSLLGMEGGLENLRLFAEFGFGEQGIVLAGLKYKF